MLSDEFRLAIIDAVVVALADIVVSGMLSANNIFDVTARRHASFLKDFAPLAGRDLRVTLRFGI